MSGGSDPEAHISLKKYLRGKTNRRFVMLVKLAKVVRVLQDIGAPSSNIRARIVQLQATLRSLLRQDVIPVSQRYTTAWSTRQKDTGSVLGVRHLSRWRFETLTIQYLQIFRRSLNFDKRKASNFCEHHVPRKVTDFGSRSTIFYLHTIVTATGKKSRYWG